MKRFLSLLLMVSLLLSMCPVGPAVRAEEMTDPAQIQETEAAEPADPTEECSEPAEESSEPTEETAEPSEETTVPTEEVTEPTEVTEPEIPAETEGETEEETQETIPEETEPAAKEEEETVSQMPVNVQIRQTANSKVFLSWEQEEGAEPAASYVIGEWIDGKFVRRGYTTDMSITISSVAYGVHRYYIYPCSTVKGSFADCDEAVCAFADIYTYKQTWRTAPSISAGQYSIEEMSFYIRTGYSDTAEYYLFELTDADGVFYLLFDYLGERIDESEEVFQLLAGPGESAGKYSVNGEIQCSISSMTIPLCRSEYEANWAVKIRLIRAGKVNNEGLVERGAASKKKSMTLKPQWAKAPKVTYHYQPVGTDPRLYLQWNFTGKPTGFDLYDGTVFVKHVPAPAEGLGLNWQSTNLPLSSAGKHTIKIYPVRDGVQGTACKKSFSVSVPWMTTKPAVTLSQPAENTVRVDWNPVNGAEGYEVFQVVKEGKSYVGKSLGRTNGSTWLAEGLELGYNSFMVRPYSSQLLFEGDFDVEDTTERELLGKFSTKKTIKVRQLWKSAPKNLNVDLLNAVNNSIRIRWDAPGAPEHFVVKVVQGKTVVEELTIEANAYTPRMTDLTLPDYGTYKFYVRAEKGGVFSPWSSAKKFVYSAASAPVGQYRALVIGNTYAESASPLPGCETDANTITAMLGSMNATPYTVETRLNLTAVEISKAIHETFADAKPQDISLFYYSGHGSSGTGNLVGADMSGVSFQTLRSELDRIPGRKIVLLDSCYSGQAINKALGDPDDAEVEAYLNAAMAAFSEPKAKSGELAATNYYVITACSKSQTSWEVNLGGGSRGGAFTYCLERVCGWSEISNSALSSASADSNHDGFFSLHEVFTGTDSLVKSKGYTQMTRVNPTGSPFILFGRK